MKCWRSMYVYRVHLLVLHKVCHAAYVIRAAKVRLVCGFLSFSIVTGHGMLHLLLMIDEVDALRLDCLGSMDTSIVSLCYSLGFWLLGVQYHNCFYDVAPAILRIKKTEELICDLSAVFQSLLQLTLRHSEFNCLCVVESAFNVWSHHQADRNLEHLQWCSFFLCQIWFRLLTLLLEEMGYSLKNPSPFTSAFTADFWLKVTSPGLFALCQFNAHQSQSLSQFL
jgi:hypothetical protein